MIYTVTLNPSIDYIMFTKDFSLGELNRAQATYKFAGGKGINVSRVLKQHQIDSTALGYIGGFPGEFIRNELASEYIRTDFITVDSDTRINVKLKGDTETEINAPGPSISTEHRAQLIEQINRLTENDTVILSGSVPASMDKDIYREIAQTCHGKGIKFVVDAEKELLTSVLPFHPEFVKPNKVELEEMFDMTLSTDQEITDCALKLINQGAKMVMVSMGGDGALLVTKERIYKAVVPHGKVINTVGAGDSTVAGMMAGLTQSRPLEESFRLAVASGTATAFTEDLATAEQIQHILHEIEVSQL